jgi:hypothetical protein
VTQTEAIRELNELAATGEGDIEAAHGNADGILCELLTELGYADVVEAWNKVPKWYA